MFGDPCLGEHPTPNLGIITPPVGSVYGRFASRRYLPRYAWRARRGGYQILALANPSPACMLLLAAVLAFATSAPKDAQTPMR